MYVDWSLRRVRAVLACFSIDGARLIGECRWSFRRDGSLENKTDCYRFGMLGVFRMFSGVNVKKSLDNLSHSYLALYGKTRETPRNTRCSTRQNFNQACLKVVCIAREIAPIRSSHDETPANLNSYVKHDQESS